MVCERLAGAPVGRRRCVSSGKRFRMEGTMIKEIYRRLREESPVPRLAFYIGLTIELLMVIIDKSNYINPIEGYLFRLTFLLFACKLLLTRYERWEWAIIFVMEAVALISYRVTGANDIIRIVTFVAACKGIPLKEALKYTFYVTLAGCLAGDLRGYQSDAGFRS